MTFVYNVQGASYGTLPKPMDDVSDNVENSNKVTDDSFKKRPVSSKLEVNSVSLMTNRIPDDNDTTVDDKATTNDKNDNNDKQSDTPGIPLLKKSKCCPENEI